MIDMFIHLLVHKNSFFTPPDSLISYRAGRRAVRARQEVTLVWAGEEP
jgi:hypothetical protein